jgi:hypothetical protein
MLSTKLTATAVGLDRLSDGKSGDFDQPLQQTQCAWSIYWTTDMAWIKDQALSWLRELLYAIVYSQGLS